MVSAVRAFRYVQDRQKQFCDDVRLGMEQLEWGEFNEYDEAGLKSRFQEFKRQAVSGTGKKGGADR